MPLYQGIVSLCLVSEAASNHACLPLLSTAFWGNFCAATIFLHQHKSNPSLAPICQEGGLSVCLESSQSFSDTPRDDPLSLIEQFLEDLVPIESAALL